MGIPTQAGWQQWNADGYAKNARFVADLADGVVGWLDPQAGEHILDVGCGDGALTEKLVASGATVRGVDASPDLLAAAEARGLDVALADARALAFDQDFDAVFSNAVLHWVHPPIDAARGMFAALKPGGRYVVEFGGHGNVAAIVTAMRAIARARNADAELARPWYFPTPAEHTALLESVGFEVMRAELIPRPTPLPTGMAGWLATFRKPFFEQFAEGVPRETALAEVEELLRPTLCDTEGHWTADYVRVRVHAKRPA